MPPEVTTSETPTPRPPQETRTRATSPDSVLRAYVTSIRLLLTAWVTHFRSLGYIKDSTLDLLDRTVCKQSVELTVRDYKAREVIGGSEAIWNDLVELFRAATPSLEQRSYGPGDPLNPNVDGPSSNVIVANNVTLLRDLQRLDNMLSLARNVLTAGMEVQNLAARVGFDREVCAMINLCVKITARSYDGDGSNVDEDKWQGVINGFKKLLITCLQFLSNLVTMNERLKLMLWTELFDSPSKPQPLDAAAPTSAAQDLAKATDRWVLGATKAFSADEEILPEQIKQSKSPSTKPKAPLTPYFMFVQENRAKIKAQLSLRTEPTPKQVMQEGTRRWNIMSEKEKQVWRQAYNERHARYKQDLEEWEIANPGAQTPDQASQAYRDAASIGLVPRSAAQGNEEELLLGPTSQYATTYSQAGTPPSTAPVSMAPKVRASRMIETGLYTDEYDLPPPENLMSEERRMISAVEGLRRLTEGKNQMLKRLDAPTVNQKGTNKLDSRTRDVGGAGTISEMLDSDAEELDEEYDEDGEDAHLKEGNGVVEDDADEDGEYDDDEGPEEDEEDEGFEDGEEEEDGGEGGKEEGHEDEESDVEESSDDEDFAIPGEDGRGLLTDVPLILGPNEIEVLPMIVMSGIVPPKDEPLAYDYAKALSNPVDAFNNLYIVRCHLLLAQENGRNLLRELLIFVAAWDLRDEELYFKFMVKIMEAILMVGLMPFAYVAFKESKDIISPAQAVIMKLLTKIFHFRQAFTDREPLPAEATQDAFLEAAGPQIQLTFDTQVVQTLFGEFRQHIIPQICALIFLQGQIRLGLAHVEDFPLNLWDMERMYEGVYQYLEFFAILTDHDRWKQMMAEWEVTSELITLLRELAAAIPKGRVMTNAQALRDPPVEKEKASPETSHEEDDQIPMADKPTAQPAAPVAVERPYDVNPTVPEPLNPASDNEVPVASGTSPYPEAHDEPADFEWRNLKKLCVLVLSSLVWKNRRLQDQVRSFGGIEAILSCCSFDEHNPYIREHAIMCLRFLVEGNKENQDAVRSLAKQSEATGIAVPAEVLDHHGYETFMDGKGQVGLRRKEVPGALKALSTVALAVGEGAGKDVWATAGQGLPEWMQLLIKRRAEITKA